MSWSHPHLSGGAADQTEQFPAKHITALLPATSCGKSSLAASSCGNFLGKASAVYFAHGGQLLPPIHDAGKNGDMAVPVKASAASTLP